MPVPPSRAYSARPRLGEGRRFFFYAIALPLAAVLVALLLVSGRTLMTSARAAGTAGTGTISGYVFHDLDRDGVRDDGEPGLERLVQLVQNGVIIQEGGSESDGSYSFAGVPPGDYELVTGLSEQTRFCEEPGVLGFFDPLALFGCSPLIDQPWHATTPERLQVAVAGQTLEADFGGVPFDQSVLIGRAILEDDYAPRGTLVEAVVGDRVCGTAAVGPADGIFGFPVFMLVILGEGEREGCAKAGEPVGFRVGGIRASQIAPFKPQIEQTSPSRFQLGIDAMTNVAWYWLRQPSGELPPAGSVLTAFVDGVTCGSVTLERGPLGAPVTGFARLIVPSNSVKPGCGRDGAVVKFSIDGTASETEIPWAAGLQRISLSFPQPTQSPAGSPTPAATTSPPATPVQLPEAGGSAAGPPGRTTPTAAVLAGLAGVLLACFAFHLFKTPEEDAGQSG